MLASQNQGSLNAFGVIMWYMYFSLFEFKTSSTLRMLLGLLVVLLILALLSGLVVIIILVVSLWLQADPSISVSNSLGVE